MISKEVIKEREKTLRDANKYLKTQFVGIDSIIDQFTESIKIWFLLPEVQSRPLIINLWGITGVGKTDLIRKFVKVFSVFIFSYTAISPFMKLPPRQ